MTRHRDDRAATRRIMNIGNTRNRWLLGALGLVALFYAGDAGYRKFYEEPAKDHERTLTTLEKRLADDKLKLAKAKRVGEQLELLEQKSLPWDAEMARARYQDWLLQLAQDAKLTGTSVDSSNPVSVTASRGRGKAPAEMFKRFTFSLRGRGELGQITRFLYDFYRGGHLHKIRSMSLNPLSDGQQVDLSVSIEALALPNADRQDQLTTIASEQLAHADVRDYQLISRRNFFSSGGAASAWKQIRLSAVTSDVRGVQEAWFLVGADPRTQVLQTGQTLSLPSLELRVVSLDDTSATVDADGSLYRVAIGQSLAEATRVQDATPEPASPLDAPPPAGE
jgi:hypothetical protein